jgi:hypothetical protein
LTAQGQAVVEQVMEALCTWAEQVHCHLPAQAAHTLEQLVEQATRAVQAADNAATSRKGAA